MIRSIQLASPRKVTPGSQFHDSETSFDAATGSSCSATPWVMLEMFRSRAAWDEHMQQPYNVEGNKILEDLLREPSELRLMDEK